MPRQVRTLDANAAELAALLEPRNDLVAECRGPITGTDTGEVYIYEFEDGPFTHYRREVRTVVGEAAAGVAAGATIGATTGESSPQVTRVDERVEWQLAVPWFGPLVNLPVRHAMRNFRSGDGSQPVWAPPQRIDARASTVLAALAAAAMLAGFLSNAPSELHTYAADEYGSGPFSQGVLGVVVRIGTLLAIGVSVLTDRHGRRRVIGAAMVLGVLSAAIAAAAPNMVSLMGVLLVVRTANAALGATILVVALEEMPSGCRAWSLSVLALSASLGAGIVVWFQPLADVAVWGWRLIFLVPLASLPLLRSIMSHLPESRRFERRAVNVELSAYWRRIALLGTVYLLLALFLGPIDWFRNEYLRDEHSFSAAQVTLFLLSTATPAGIGLYVAGRLAESKGRRIVVAAATVVGLGGIVAMYNVTGAALWFLALGGAMLSVGLLPALGVYRGEMFPTGVRARAATIVGAMGVVGSGIGILLTGWLRTEWGSFGNVIALLWIAPLIATAVVMAFFAEGGRHELEELNPEDASTPEMPPNSATAGESER